MQGMGKIAGWTEDFGTLNYDWWDDYNPLGVGSISIAGSVLTISVPRDGVDRYRGLYAKRALNWTGFEILTKIKWNVPAAGIIQVELNKDFESGVIIAQCYRYYFYYYGASAYYVAKTIGGVFTQLGTYALLNNAPVAFEYWRMRYRKGLMTWDRSTVSEDGPWTRFVKATDKRLIPPFRLALICVDRATAPALSTSYLYVDWVKVSKILPKMIV